MRNRPSALFYDLIHCIGSLLRGMADHARCAVRRAGHISSRTCACKHAIRSNCRSRRACHSGDNASCKHTCLHRSSPLSQNCIYSLSAAQIRYAINLWKSGHLCFFCTHFDRLTKYGAKFLTSCAFRRKVSRRFRFTNLRARYIINKNVKTSRKATPLSRSRECGKAFGIRVLERAVDTK